MSAIRVGQVLGVAAVPATLGGAALADSRTDQGSPGRIDREEVFIDAALVGAGVAGASLGGGLGLMIAGDRLNRTGLANAGFATHKFAGGFLGGVVGAAGAVVAVGLVGTIVYQGAKLAADTIRN